MVIILAWLLGGPMNHYDIEQVLPHSGPMILIDTLEHYTASGCCCRVSISNDSMFYQQGNKGVPSYVGTEYMAQAIAAFAGANALDKNQQVKIGFLLGSRKYKTTKPYFYLGCRLDICVEELYQEDSGLSVFECTITDQDNCLLAMANINVFQPENSKEFLQDSYE